MAGQVLHEIRRVGTDPSLRGITAISSDPSEELIWIGNTQASFKAHAGAVSQLAVTDYGVFSVGGNTARLTARRGLPQWTVQEENTKKMIAMCLPTTPSSNELVVAGEPTTLMLVNIHRGTITRLLDSAGVETKVMRKSRLLCCGTANGKIMLRDPRSYRVEHTIDAHSGSVNDMDVAGYTLMTCGSSERAGAHVREPLVKIYDLRTMRALPPVSFTARASFLRFLPKLSSTALIGSSNGQFQICDVMNNSAAIQFYHLEGTGSPLTVLDVSSSGEVVTFGDGSGVLYQYADRPQGKINMYSRPSEYPTLPRNTTYIGLDDDRPLNSIGMSYYTEPLLSVFPNTPFPAHQPPAFIPSEILSNVKMIDFVGYAQNPNTFRRNQRLRDTSKAREDMEQPKFRSEQERAQMRKPVPDNKKQRERPLDGGGAVDDASDAVGSENGIPRAYRLVEIKYSRFGVEDFDFAFYNKTPYSGLETHIQSSYCNAIVQVLFFNHVFREIAKAHIRLSCNKEFCLTCELGFLFRMLEDGKGVNCQATNFLRAFATLPQAAALGLLELDVVTTPVSYSSMIQSCNRFILEQAHQECMAVGMSYPIMTATKSNLSVIQQLYGHESSSVSTCDVCGNSDVRETMPFVVDMMYRKIPQPTSGKGPIPPLPPMQSFTETLQSSLRRESTTRAWCSTCSRYQPLTQTRAIKHFPVVLNINACVSDNDHTGWWTAGWASMRFAMSITEDAVVVQDSLEGQDVPQGFVVYELTSIVSEILQDGRLKHLISHVRVDDDEASPSWHVFNDFLVDKVSTSSVLEFKEWRTPSVSQYRRVDVSSLCDLSSLPKSMDQSILMDSQVLNRRRELSITYKRLTPEETQSLKGALCGLDAEFVALSKEESEVRSDGVRQVVRPSRLGLARVSVTRGFEPEDDTPFIDEYISTTEEVVDYLTDYSGIAPGDLDPAVSLHPLVPLKVAYKKLRMLVDQGCIFVGHGLKKDLRIINILVPPDQIIDTVDLFYVKSRQRRISLRFLAWYLLGEQIQADSHDSVEDAQAALLLYRKYKELVYMGVLESTLEEVYEEGRALNFKVPTPPSPDQPAS
ncbi:hypothetical protein SmJEL517_g01378 [Synchytrium microbalum]|uniref:PAN2-PAN3 deadenylation complex catalytic subunit PAN2 n=1 Tax=Synchytrium microbalum TaxID=1806994 RepID=A0A507CG16_9FUNG|nr:uncharacterized protein SmJEL517_g01378 [Synchytrium microbalum]TPX36525.1 hypothetical protein SmJEL517_g01378 [Synchytrium microbalum]